MGHTWTGQGPCPAVGSLAQGLLLLLLLLSPEMAQLLLLVEVLLPAATSQQQCSQQLQAAENASERPGQHLR